MFNQKIHNGSAHGMRRAPWTGSRTAALLLTLAVVACGESTEEVIGPPLPGSLVLATETSGFLQDDSYEIFVNGQSQGMIGANAEMTLGDLDPATYEVTLGDVAENCVAESTTLSVSVASQETAAAAVTVVCAAPAPTPYTIRESRDRPDLDTGTIVECPFLSCPSNDTWDFYTDFKSQGDPQATIVQNVGIGVEVAHVAGVTLATLTEADYESASFSAEVGTEPFAPENVVLVRTDQGAVYALGNPVETTLTLTLTFDAVQIVRPTAP